jgi:hypothetical protein
MNDEISNKDINFTELNLSTATIAGQFCTDITFDQKELIRVVEPNERVVRLCCNYGDKIHSSYDPPENTKSKRGRKPQVKNVGNRRHQGNGSSFNSQVSFHVLGDHFGDATSPLCDKIYKVKVFQNLKFQIPGVRHDDGEDVETVIEAIRQLLLQYLPMCYVRYSEREIERLTKLRLEMKHTRAQLRREIKTTISYPRRGKYTSPADRLTRNYTQSAEHKAQIRQHQTIVDKGIPDIDISVEGLKFIMKNYGCCIIDKSIVINLEEFKVCLNEAGVDKTVELESVRYDPESYPGLVIKIRPAGSSAKYTALKIFSSGKINLQNCNVHEHKQALMDWLQKYLQMNKHRILIRQDV